MFDDGRLRTVLAGSAVLGIGLYLASRRREITAEEENQILVATSELGCAREIRVFPETWKSSTKSLHTFCPCCRKPVEIKNKIIQREGKPKRRAYCSLLFGDQPEYFLGALVLGYSLKKTQTSHDLVLLYTNDLPKEYLDELKKIWRMKLVKHVEVARAELYSAWALRQHRFAHVFTKLHAFNLVEYDKVLLLDLDILVRQNIDDIFNLPAPAAMRRGNQDSQTNGFGWSIDGANFFGESSEVDVWEEFYGKKRNVEQEENYGLSYQWSQMNGINAGVMLLPTSRELFENVLRELIDPSHPEHIPCPGPEQDYLSRLFADSWSNLTVDYNFQLHHLYFYLDGLGGDRSIMKLEDVKVIHYSGDESKTKPWVYVLESNDYRNHVDVEEFTQRCTWEYARNADYLRSLSLRGSIVAEVDRSTCRETKEIANQEVVKRADRFVVDSTKLWIMCFEEMKREVCPDILETVLTWRLRNFKRCADCGYSRRNQTFCDDCENSRWRRARDMVFGWFPQSAEEEVKEFEYRSDLLKLWEETEFFEYSEDQEFVRRVRTGKIWYEDGVSILTIYDDFGDEEIWLDSTRRKIYKKRRVGNQVETQFELHWVTSTEKLIEWRGQVQESKELTVFLWSVFEKDCTWSLDFDQLPPPEERSSKIHVLVGEKAGAGKLEPGRLVAQVPQYSNFSLRFDLKPGKVDRTFEVVDYNLIYFSASQDPDFERKFGGCPGIYVRVHQRRCYLLVRHSWREGDLITSTEASVFDRDLSSQNSHIEIRLDAGKLEVRANDEIWLIRDNFVPHTRAVNFGNVLVFCSARKPQLAADFEIYNAVFQEI